MSAYDEWEKSSVTEVQVRRAQTFYELDAKVERARRALLVGHTFTGDPVTGFAADDRRLAAMHGYRPAMAINLRGPRAAAPGFLNALSRAYRRVRREVWTQREAALRGERWEGIG